MWQKGVKVLENRSKNQQIGQNNLDKKGKNYYIYYRRFYTERKKNKSDVFQ